MMKAKILIYIILSFITFKAADAQELKFSNVKTGYEYYEMWDNQGPIHSSYVNEVKSWIGGMELWNALCKAVETGKAEAFAPEDLAIKFTIDSIRQRLNRLVRVDSVTVIDPGTFEEELRIVIEEFDPSRILGWNFIEHITINVNEKKVSKKVSYIIPIAAKYDYYTGEFLYGMPVMAVKLSPELKLNANAQTIKFNGFTNKVNVNPWGDGDFSIWEQQFKSDAAKKIEVWNGFNKLLETGKAEAYNVDDLTIKLSMDEIKTIKQGIRTDTLYVEDYNTGELVVKVIGTERDPATIASWNFIESMVYNINDNSITKQVEYIIPKETVYDDYTGDIRGWRSLMAIKLN